MYDFFADIAVGAWTLVFFIMLLEGIAHRLCARQIKKAKKAANPPVDSEGEKIPSNGTEHESAPRQLIIKAAQRISVPGGCENITIQARTTGQPNNIELHISGPGKENISLINAEGTDIDSDSQYAQQLAYWKKQIQKENKLQKKRLAELNCRIDEILLEGKLNFDQIAEKLETETALVRKRHKKLFREGRYHCPLFE